MEFRRLGIWILKFTSFSAHDWADLGGSFGHMRYERISDSAIREAFHRVQLRRQHVALNTLVVDELGIMHGRWRADIAVVNGHLIGYEIKSDEDSLSRLPQQVLAYNNVFDRASIVVGMRHLRAVRKTVPKWWGVVVARASARRSVCFETLRLAEPNPVINTYAVAQLLWKPEVVAILTSLGFNKSVRHKPRTHLYRLLEESLDENVLRRQVRQCLKARKSWRCP
jgi:hypothetical protein